MSQHEKAPKEFVNTFNSAWNIGIRSVVLISVVLLAMFFYNLHDSFVALFMTLLLALAVFGLWKLLAALFIGPADPDTQGETNH